MIVDNHSTGQNYKYLCPESRDIRIFDFSSLPEIDGIFHLAARASIPDSLENPYESNESNVSGMMRVLDYARTNNIPVVYSSSSSIYGDAKFPTNELEPASPLSPYAFRNG